MRHAMQLRLKHFPFLPISCRYLSSIKSIAGPEFGLILCWNLGWRWSQAGKFHSGQPTQLLGSGKNWALTKKSGASSIMMRFQSNNLLGEHPLLSNLNHVTYSHTVHGCAWRSSSAGIHHYCRPNSVKKRNIPVDRFRSDNPGLCVTLLPTCRKDDKQIHETVTYSRLFVDTL